MAGSSRSFTAIRKGAGLFCGSFLRKGQMFAQVGRSHGKVDVTLPGKGNSSSHGARQVHLIITMIKWIQTSGLPINDFLSLWAKSKPERAKKWWQGSRKGVGMAISNARLITSGGRAPLVRLIHTWTSFASKTSLRQTGVGRTCRLISPCGPPCGHDCVKSFRSSYTG